MQVHILGREEQVNYFSRNGIEHGEHSNYSVLDPVVKRQVAADRVILDGEVVIWNKTRRAAPMPPAWGFYGSVLCPYGADWCAVLAAGWAARAWAAQAALCWQQTSRLLPRPSCMKGRTTVIGKLN